MYESELGRIMATGSLTYVDDRVGSAVFLGAGTAGSRCPRSGRRFIAITDLGSKLQQVASVQGFRDIFFGLPSIGGRYSALSNFGMVPAAIMGVDVSKFLDYAEEMVHSCAASVPAQDNPGVVLGTILGVLAN